MLFMCYTNINIFHIGYYKLIIFLREPNLF